MSSDSKSFIKLDDEEDGDDSDDAIIDPVDDDNINNNNNGNNDRFSSKDEQFNAPNTDSWIILWILKYQSRFHLSDVQ